MGRHSLRVGADVALHLVMSVPRCVMTTLAQDDLPADKGILQTVARENRFDIPGLGPSSCVGVYGLVSAGGAIAVGDRDVEPVRARVVESAGVHALFTVGKVAV